MNDNLKGAKDIRNYRKWNTNESSTSEKNIQPYSEWEIDTKIVLRFYFSHEIGKNNSVVNTEFLFFF